VQQRSSVDVVPAEAVQVIVLTPALKWGFGLLGALACAYGVWLGSSIMGLRDSVVLLQERVAALSKDACNHTAQAERDRSQDVRIVGLERRLAALEAEARQVRLRRLIPKVAK